MRGPCVRLILAAALAVAAAPARAQVVAEDVAQVVAQDAAQVVAQDLLGRTITSVAFTCDGPADAHEIASLVDLEVGRPLTRDGTGATIENLFATLDFSNVLVVAEADADGGVAVTIHLWRAYRVSRVVFDGKSSLSGEDMRRAIPFSERDPFNGTSLAEGAAALERKLAADGYIHASVEPEATFEAATFTVDVVYRIAAGERARMAAPFFDGKLEPYTAEELLAGSKLKVGASYREARARTAAEKLRKYLLDQGRYKASVDLIAAEPTEQGEIRPVFRLTVGPPYVIEAAGLTEKQARKEILALLEGQGLDEDLLEQWANTTREGLQRAGRYKAKVTAVATGTDPVVVKLTIDAGEKYAVEKVVLAGNDSVSTETLQALIVTRPKGLPLIQKGRLIDGDIEADASAVLGYYQTHGWISAKVDKPAITEGSKPDLLDVAITVIEGPRTFVATRQIDGVGHLTPAEIDTLVAIREGEPFNPSLVQQDVSSLTTRYRNTGWREAAVRDHWTVSPDKTKVDVVYTVDEGSRSFFGKTILRGNAVTDPDRILRQVAWKEGEPYSEEKIADTQKNLARTGVFRSIEVRPQPVNPDNEEHNVDISLTEARRISLLYGVGYQYSGSGTSNPNDPFVTLGVSYRNLFGRMQSASVEVQYAPLSQRGYVVANFLEPYLFNTDVPLTFGVFASREPIQQVDIDRFGVFLESARQIGALRVGLRYSYQQIAPTNAADLGTIVLEKFPRSAFPIKQSAIGPNLLYDRRDDVLNPQKGYYATLSGNYAFPFLNADAHYGKVSGQGAWFVSVLGGVLAASVRAGGLFPASAEAEGTVPIAEKFFAGGSSTARGFDTDLEGIPAETVDYNAQATLKPATQTDPGSCDSSTYDFRPGVNPALYNCSPGPRIIGGNGFLAMGLEYRFPIFGNLGISVFYDLAQVWTNPGQINVGIEGATGLRQSIGAGLHYITPIGPLRLEYGRPVQLRTIPSTVTSTEGEFDGAPCDIAHPCILGTLKTKETGRILLSIGYPF
jgi:outer membrane protein insertion porin family